MASAPSNNASTGFTAASKLINLDEPRWDQTTYLGRAKHFFVTTNPFNVLRTDAELQKAKEVVQAYKRGEPLKLSDDEIWHYKHIYDSAFHPDTKEKMNLFGRMSFQVPGNMLIVGCMLTFYKTNSAVIFWQWFNQTFNAVVNYTNRSGDSPVPVSRLGVSYAIASGASVATALGINWYVAPKLPPLLARFGPFAAVAAANCINIPFMRSQEFSAGIPVTDANGERVGESRAAAKKAVAQVVVSRILMASPGMFVPPIIMNALEKRPFLKKYPWANAPIQIGLCGVMLTFATPLCCALFPQKSSIAVSDLEPELRAKLTKSHPDLSRVYYNKGL